MFSGCVRWVFTGVLGSFFFVVVFGLVRVVVVLGEGRDGEGNVGGERRGEEGRKLNAMFEFFRGSGVLCSN